MVDEFYGWISLDLLLRILDRYPLTVETKGGHRTFRAKTVVITSNKPFEKWYPNVRDAGVLAALKRRMEQGKVEFVGTEEYPTAEKYLEAIDDIVDEGDKAYSKGWKK